MRILPSILVLALAAAPAAALGPSPTQAAQDAALAWLQLVDSGRYAASYFNAAAFLRQTVTREGWEYALKSERTPLGPLRSRRLKSVTFTRNLPGSPAGEYVIIQYDTAFGKRGTVTETVTPMHEADGGWKVAGYAIR